MAFHQVNLWPELEQSSVSIISSTHYYNWQLSN